MNFRGMWGGFSAMIGPERNDRCGQRLWRCIVRTRGFLSIVGCVLLMLGCGGGSTPEPLAEEIEIAEVVEGAAPERHDQVFVCGCGEACDCGAVAVEAGTCDCGTPLEAARLIKVEGHEALLCACGGDCSCAVDAEDGSKCTCGTDIRRVSFDGTGLYFCNCGGSCTCNYVVATPGRCTCGMELVSG